MASPRRTRLIRKATVPGMSTRVNEALRKGVAGPQQLDDFNDFLGEMLEAVAHIAGAQTGWVVLLDTNATTYELAAVMSRDGELVPRAKIHFQAIPVTAEFIARMTDIARGAAGWALSPLDPLHSPEARAFHAAQGSQALLHIPMRAAGRLIGWVGFGFSRPDASFGPAHLVLEVLVAQMATAVELSRLAELKEQTARVRESEKAAQLRAAELAKANETITNTLGHLIRSREPDAFVPFALLELAEKTRAAAAQVFRYSPASNELRQMCAVRNGELFPHGHPDDPPEFQLGFDAGVTSAYQRLCEAGGVVWHSADAPAADTWPFLVSWNWKMNHSAYGGIALFKGSQPMGLLVLEFTERASLTEIQSQLFVAMSLLISLALEIAELSEQGRRAAFANESERTAQETAAELATANRALNRSAERLATHPTTKAYLDAVLLEASVAARARTAFIYELDRTGRTLTLTACAIDNEIIDVATDSRMESMRPPVILGDYAFWKKMPQVKSRWLHIETELPQIWRFSIPWHHQMGHKTLAAFPLLIGDKHIGSLSLCFAAQERPTQPRLELCLTLSQHAALAIELNRLSNEAAEAATLEERNRIAREIHDTLAQSFTGVLMHLQAVDHLGIQHNRDRIHLENAANIARMGLAEARRSVRALRPSELDSGSLVEALKLVARLVEQRSGVSVIVNCDASAGIEPAHSGEILRIVQEAVANAVTHACATVILVNCSKEGGSLLVSITDNGGGFKVERKTEGFGLIGMRERAAKIGGDLRVSSGTDGTVISLSIPSPKEAL